MHCGNRVCRTSSALVGWGASSFFISIFCFRLSLLAARVGFSPSPSLEADRLAVGVPPRAAREFDDDICTGCEPVAACEGVLDEAMDDDEFLERAVGGVGEARLSIWGGGALLLFTHDGCCRVEDGTSAHMGLCPCREWLWLAVVMHHARAGLLV